MSAKGWSLGAVSDRLGLVISSCGIWEAVIAAMWSEPARLDTGGYPEDEVAEPSLGSRSAQLQAWND